MRSTVKRIYEEKISYILIKYFIPKSKNIFLNFQKFQLLELKRVEFLKNSCTRSSLHQENTSCENSGMPFSEVGENEKYQK